MRPNACAPHGNVQLPINKQSLHCISIYTRHNLTFDVRLILLPAIWPTSWFLTSARTLFLASGMGVAHLYEPAGQSPVADDLVRAVAVRDECAVIVSEMGGGAAAMLDRVQDELSYRRIRCVRISTPPLGSLSLRGLMAQILGRPDSYALTDRELEAGFTALTEPGAGYDRVALLIDGAHSLQLPALRYIQLACQSSPKLRVVLAGRPALDGLLVRNEFGPLHQQIKQRFEFAASPLAGLAMKSVPSRRGSGRRVPPRWLTSLNTGLGALASSALIVSLALWVLPLGSSPAPPPPASAAGADDRVASAPEAPAAPLATWTRQPADAPEPAAEAPAPSADSVPAAAHDTAPAAAVPAVPLAELPSIPDQPPRLDPPPAEPVPEVHVVDLESEAASLRKIEPKVEPTTANDHSPDPAASRLAASSLAAPGRLPAQPPPQPVRRIAAAPRQAAAPDESEGGRRCRDIVLNAQLGRTPSHADVLFLQNGCRTK